MTDRFNKAFKTSMITHVVVISIALILPLFSRCSKPVKPPVEVVFVDFDGSGPAGGGGGGGGPSIPEPAPPAPEPPRPEPTPAPDPIKIPEKTPEPKPVKPEIKKPKEIKVNTNRVVRKDVPKQVVEPAKPKLTQAQLREMLGSDLPTTPSSTFSGSRSLGSGSAGSGGGGSGSGGGTELGRYYGKVYKALYAVWARPPGISGLKTTVSIRIFKNGAVTAGKMVSSSGNKEMDNSVMDAVNAVKTLPPLPGSISEPYIDVTIQFESSGLSM